VLSDIDAWRRNFALLNGADAAYDPREDLMGERVGMPSGGYDLILEASGTEAALQAAIQLAHRGGTIVQVGTLPTQTTLPANLIMNKELALLGSFRFADEMKTALNLLASKSNDFSAFITHTLPFDQFVQAMKLASGRGQTIKVQVIP
jgi:L-idonate 5-dehydrogenase